MIALEAGSAEALILPPMGAGLARLDVGGRPALRPWTGRIEDGPFALALNLLAPFSNRVSGGFATDAGRTRLAPNLAGEPFAIHGDAFQRAWTVTAQTSNRMALALEDGAFGPLRYGARVEYRLAPDRLELALRLVSRAGRKLPFGGGFHPWFPRSAATRLRFRAAGCWPEDARHLPATATPVAAPPAWRWDRFAALPAGWINAGFAGWDGRAEIAQGPDAVSVALGAEGLSTAILYSPGAASDFFCFEPVSHPVDAHNLPGRPGLVELSPGEALDWRLTLAWS